MILVTGASGLLGASLVALLQSRGREVLGLYHHHRVEIGGASLAALDLTDESQTERLFEQFQPATVIHCAAATNLDWCEEHPEEARRVNVTASKRIAEITSRTGVRMLHVSTDAVFDGERGDYAETDQPAPLGVYARTKLEAEHAVIAQNPRAVIARVTLYGWNLQPKLSLAEWILDRLSQGEVVPGFIDTIFCPILANDLAEILLAMVDRDLVGLYHVVGCESISKYEFAGRIALQFGFDSQRVIPARLAEAKLKAPRPLNTSLNTQRICDALGRPMPDVDSGLRRFAELRADGYGQRPTAPATGVRLRHHSV